MSKLVSLFIWFSVIALSYGSCCNESSGHFNPFDDEKTVGAGDVAASYVRIAHSRYSESLKSAQLLLKETRDFLKAPSEKSHENLKKAWLTAHLTYSRCEVFRFGNPNVDAWESKVNAWPMDEGLIDYVSEDYLFHEGNPHARRNIIQKGRLPVTDELISEFQSGADPKAAPVTSITDMESNVTTGFHAIEFLLWGQDTGTEQGQSGKRSYTDFLTDERATNGFNDRRRNYLIAAVRLLCADLRRMVIEWDPQGRLYSKVFLELPPEEQARRILLGLGSLCYAEMAIERMRVALMTSDQEEEQSCFSDTTLLAIHSNAVAIETLYLGSDGLLKGKAIQASSLSAWVKQSRPELDLELQKAFVETRRQVVALARNYEHGKYFDWMIRADNQEGRKQINDLIDQLRHQATLLEKVQNLVLELAKK